MTSGLQNKFNMTGQNRDRVTFAATAVGKVIEGIFINLRVIPIYGGRHLLGPC
jgi:hypothetical protein